MKEDPSTKAPARSMGTPLAVRKVPLWLHRLRRFLLFQALFFAFGGFLFYAGVVVPIASDVIGSTTQGFVTQRVTQVLNIASSLAGLMLVIEIAFGWNERSRQRRLLLCCCTGLIVTATLMLFLLHGQLDVMLKPQDFEVLDHAAFYQRHRMYLWTSTVQWLATLPVTWSLANESN